MEYRQMGKCAILFYKYSMGYSRRLRSQNGNYSDHDSRLTVVTVNGWVPNLRFRVLGRRVGLLGLRISVPVSHQHCASIERFLRRRVPVNFGTLPHSGPKPIALAPKAVPAEVISTEGEAPVLRF